MQNLTVYQIYFHQNQQKFLEPGLIPFYNSDCTVYFENSVIRKLIEQGAHKQSDYFGVVSYKLISKINKEFSYTRLKAHIEEQRPNVVYLHSVNLPTDPIQQADMFHPNFSKLFTNLLKRIGYEYSPVSGTHFAACNHFVAGSIIYERYVKDLLIPAMDEMKKMPEFMQDAGYPRGPLPANLQDKFGISWYPYHPFICERLFWFYVHINKFNVYCYA